MAMLWVIRAYNYRLIEEVGKVVADAPTDIKVGDRLEVIPNHSCSTANLTKLFHRHKRR